MKCPMLMYNYPPGGVDMEGAHTDCLKEKCAWWDEKEVMCSVRSLADHLWLLTGGLNAIIEKMPTEEQFRKH